MYMFLCIIIHIYIYTPKHTLISNTYHGQNLQQGLRTASMMKSCTQFTNAEYTHLPAT